MDAFALILPGKKQTFSKKNPEQTKIQRNFQEIFPKVFWSYFPKNKQNSIKSRARIFFLNSKLRYSHFLVNNRFYRKFSLILSRKNFNRIINQKKEYCHRITFIGKMLNFSFFFFRSVILFNYLN